MPFFIIWLEFLVYSPLKTHVCQPPAQPKIPNSEIVLSDDVFIAFIPIFSSRPACHPTTILNCNLCNPQGEIWDFFPPVGVYGVPLCTISPSNELNTVFIAKNESYASADVMSASSILEVTLRGISNEVNSINIEWH